MPRKATQDLTIAELVDRDGEDLKNDAVREQAIEEFYDLSPRFDVSKLYHPNTKYSPEQRLFGVFAYVISGSSRKAAKLTGISDTVLRDWKRTSVWWDEAVLEVRRLKQDQLDAGLTTLIHKSVGELEDRLYNGDEHVTSSGERLRKKVSARELAYIMSTLTEKRSLLRGDPTSRTEKLDSKSVLADLKEQLEDFSRSKREKTIEGETISASTNKEGAVEGQ